MCDSKQGGSIGVFDSGMGGLTVLRALRDQMPHADLIYLGDTARLPYGTKTPETIIQYALQAAQALVDTGVSLLVVACNTASSVALPALAKAFAPIAVIGVIEPGAQRALTLSKGPIGVVATEATIAQDAYAKALIKISPEVKVCSQAAQVLVALAEEGWFTGDITRKILQRYIDPLVSQGIDSLVLGCTHFPVFREEISALYPDTTIIDSAYATALRVAELHRGAGRGSTRFLITDRRERFSRVGSYFWGERPQDVEIVDW